MLQRYEILTLLSLLGVLSACAPTGRIDREAQPFEELPPIPEREGSVRIDLVYPRDGALKPAADSTFLFGSVGTGEAELTINGVPVPVAPNGAFLAYVPVPDGGTYAFAARSGSDVDTYAFSYAVPPPRKPVIEPFDEPRPAMIVGGRDTLATGSQIVHAYPEPSPSADRKWFFPAGTRLTATGRSEGLVRVRLTSDTDAWVDSAGIRFSESAPDDPRPDSSMDVSNSQRPDSSVDVSDSQRPGSSVDVLNGQRYVDVRIGADRAPFLILPDANSVGIVMYGQPAPDDVPREGGFIESATWHGSSSDSAHLHIELSEPLWGFKAFFADDGALVVRLRQPPQLDGSNPLRGVRVLVDPGHPPGGAIGPTGLTEAEANLAVSLKLADMLRDRGADVRMTRTTGSGLVSDSQVATELWARVDLAVAEDADLLVSVHNNAFADGVNPFLNYGTETYYYHTFSAPFAEALQRHLVQVTGLPNLGAKQRSLALVRPSWMPSVLTESLFMMFPQQEAALRDSAFQEKLARAHLEGITAFLNGIRP